MPQRSSSIIIHELLAAGEAVQRLEGVAASTEAPQVGEGGAALQGVERIPVDVQIDQAHQAGEGGAEASLPVVPILILALI